MAENNELKEIATQLRQPEGEKGMEIAEMMHQTNIGMTLHAIVRLELSGNEKVLELGHGNGAHVQELLMDSPALLYFGLDISQLMHDEAKRLNQAYIESERAFFYMYDGLKVPFDDNYFDKIFTVNTIYFWSDPPGLLAELHRVLKPGGRLNITYAQKAFMQQLPFTKFHFELYDDERMMKLAGSSAFRVHSSEDRKEEVKTKTGDWVERKFTTICLIKDF